jgi:hypothetical protein
MIRLLPLALALSVSACTATLPVDEPALLIDGDADDAQAVVIDDELGIASRRIYFGIDNLGSTSADQPRFYGDFALSPSARIDLRLTPADDGRRTIGFSVYRVMDGGSFRFLGRHQGRGVVRARLTSRVGGTFVVEAWGSSAGDNLRLQLRCARRDGNCAPQQQPGELCGTRGSGVCDDGLYCSFGSDCGRADQGGRCELPPEICPAVFGPTVCGCDGQTYGTACQAAAAGVSVEFPGDCACDPATFNKVLDGSVDPRGGWLWRGVDADGTHIASTLRLDETTFSYEQVREPACLHANPPCRVATRIHTLTGAWVDHGFAVQLLPTTTPEPFMATSFGIEQNCEGMTRLTTTESGEDRAFDRDRCAEVRCAADTHCEMVDVQCVRAPCPPQPTCVPN